MSKAQKEYLKKTRERMAGRSLESPQPKKIHKKTKTGAPKASINSNSVIWDRYIKVSINSKDGEFIFSRGANVHEDASPDFYFETSANIKELTNSAIISFYNVPEDLFNSFQPGGATISIEAGYLNNMGNSWISSVFQGVIHESSTTFSGASKRTDVYANSLYETFFSQKLTYNAPENTYASKIMADLISTEKSLKLVNMELGNDVLLTNGAAFNATLKEALISLSKTTGSLIFVNNMEVSIYPEDKATTGNFSIDSTSLLDFTQTNSQTTLKTIFNPYISPSSIIKMPMTKKGRNYTGVYKVEAVKNFFSLDGDAYTELLTSANQPKTASKTKTGIQRNDPLAQTRARMAKGVKS